MILNDESDPVSPPPGKPITGIPASAIELAQQESLIQPSQEPDGRWMQLPIGVPVAGASAVQALLDERESSL